MHDYNQQNPIGLDLKLIRAKKSYPTHAIFLKRWWFKDYDHHIIISSYHCIINLTERIVVLWTPFLGPLRGFATAVELYNQTYWIKSYNESSSSVLIEIFSGYNVDETH